MKSLVLFAALCSVALGSHWAGVPGVPHDTPAVAAARAAHLAAHAAAAHGHVGVGALGVAGLGVAGLGAAGLGGWGGLGYAGGWAHGAAPLGPNGVVVDTPEVAAAKAQHLHAVAHASSGGNGAWNGGAWNAGAWNGGAWNGGAWDDGSWHGDNGQWNGDNGGVWAGHDNGQWHGEGVLDGAAFAGAGGYGAGAYGAGVYGAGAYGALNNGQWNAHLWGDKSGHGHRWRRSLLHGAVIAPAVPLAHTVAVAPALGHVAVGHLGVGHLGLGHLGLGHGLIHG